MKQFKINVDENGHISLCGQVGKHKKNGDSTQNNTSEKNDKHVLLCEELPEASEDGTLAFVLIQDIERYTYGMNRRFEGGSSSANNLFIYTNDTWVPVVDTALIWNAISVICKAIAEIPFHANITTLNKLSEKDGRLYFNGAEIALKETEVIADATD